LKGRRIGRATGPGKIKPGFTGRGKTRF